MLIAEVLKSANKMEKFANSAIDSRLSICNIKNRCKKNFELTNAIANKAILLQKFEQQLYKRDQVISCFEKITPLTSFEFPIKQQSKPEKSNQLNIVFLNLIKTEPLTNKDTINKKPQIKDNNPEERGVAKKKINMLKVIDDLIKRAGDIDVKINKNEMPGTKLEMIQILKHLAPEHFKQSPARLEKYFDMLNIKFKPGVHKNTCLEIKQIRTMIGLPTN
ncbi:Uncharacterised protein (plasmid) [Legionella adelaidensis]|uniref:Uncharacterized protein n=1 Tax=Legionella adelaidensis TaxID=45056 RepID=A0A0W0R2N3_9GAMM|nr:hypothetical protein [Legionella adelaidensis]KTC65356.1 hypothetical protein Lade_0014 [Legionella adelaidensis]VEH84822.1 Uncharacterised protein [Legionella adelaidensis]